MTLDELRHQAAADDAAICARQARLFAPPKPPRRRKPTPASRPAWVNATMPQEHASASILAGLQTYRGNQQPEPFKRKRGQGISLTPGGAPKQTTTADAVD